MTNRAERSRSIVSIVNPLLWPSCARYGHLMRRGPREIRDYRRMQLQKIRSSTAPSYQSLIHVPDIGGKFPLIVHLAPEADVLAIDLLRCIALCLEAQRADLARRIRPERLYVDGGQLAIAELLHRVVPEALDRLPSMH